MVKGLDKVKYLDMEWIVGWIKGGMALIVDGNMHKIVCVEYLEGI